MVWAVSEMCLHVDLRVGRTLKSLSRVQNHLKLPSAVETGGKEVNAHILSTDLAPASPSMAI